MQLSRTKRTVFTVCHLLKTFHCYLQVKSYTVKCSKPSYYYITMQEALLIQTNHASTLSVEIV